MSQNAAAGELQPTSQKDLIRLIERMPVRMPRTSRELFQLLSYYRADLGLDDLLSMLRSGDASPSQLTSAVLARYPGTWDQATPAGAYNAPSHLRQLLLSDEFRRQVLPAFLNAFPELARDVFIHVPKCAGTDLILNLARRQLPLAKTLEAPAWVSDEELLAVLGGLARAAAFNDRVFVYGHMELGAYVKRAGIRLNDRVFSVIRDPVHLMISQANYAVSRIRQDPTGRDPDASQVLRLLDLSRLTEEPTDQELKDLAMKALLHRGIAAPNRACTFLGTGRTVSYENALEAIIVYNVEITTTQHYGKWLWDRWSIRETTRHNTSELLLGASEVRRLYPGLLDDAITEDQKLFDVISWALGRTGRSSVTGQEIGEFAKGMSLGDLCELARDQQTSSNSVSPKSLAGSDLVVARGLKGVSRYLEQTTVEVEGAPPVRKLQSIDFGLSGAGATYRLGGWANPEPRFTWTNASESQLQLADLPTNGTCLLRLTGTPFVAANTLPFQNVELSANGHGLGTAKLREIAVIETEIPRHLIEENQSVILTIKLPNAARPTEVNGSNDARLLALAVQTLEILHVADHSAAVNDTAASSAGSLAPADPWN